LVVHNPCSNINVFKSKRTYEEMKKKKEEIKAVIFDVGGVLQLGQQQRKFQKQIHASGVHETVAKKLKKRMDQYFDSIDTYYALSIEGKITKKKLLKNLARNLESTEKKIEKLYFKAYAKEFKFNKQLYKFAKKLKKQGYRIAVLSDQWHLSEKAHLPEKYFKHFNPLVVSCFVGTRKPGSKIYKLMLKKLKLPAKQTVFIDNQKWNLLPAKKLGMKTILFKDNEQCFAELKELGILK
jgi:epoxide hydrolase-like predicted phosphatase